MDVQRRTRLASAPIAIPAIAPPERELELEPDVDVGLMDDVDDELDVVPTDRLAELDSVGGNEVRIDGETPPPKTRGSKIIPTPVSQHSFDCPTPSLAANRTRARR